MFLNFEIDVRCIFSGRRSTAHRYSHKASYFKRLRLSHVAC